jgi:phosphoglycolate phosphatase-like HAD superfamily hydrolase
MSHPTTIRTLPGSSIELVRDIAVRRPRVAVFDFDGTVSLIRGGWTDLMVGMMAESLEPLRRPGETVETLHRLIRDYVLSLNGAPTIHQMERFARELGDRGGSPAPASVYHQEYLRRLGIVIQERKGRLRAGACTADDLVVPGTHAFLEALRTRGVELTLASGTEIEFVREEAELLGLAPYFEGRIYAPGAEPRAFTKRAVMEDLLTRHGIDGAGLVSFGDGLVETEAATTLGGLAVAVCCDETHRSGVIDQPKRDSLVPAGAALVVGDYREARTLLDYLWP